MSRIVTFYSFKGGVGRTFALANIGALLAKRGKRVLLMDWDLEAPGLHRYFKTFLASKLLPEQGLIHLLGEAAKNQSASWEPFVADIEIEAGVHLSIVTSGERATDYVERVRAFSWSDFFENRQGGVVLDRWREEWKNRFDFVFVDSRTGITDIGGVCTVFLPDILVLVFSANEQSFESGVQIVRGIQDSRKNMAVARPPLAVLPLPGRFDGRDEVDEAKAWLDRFSRGLRPFYDDWLPKQFDPRQILELTKIPYITKFSFGEQLAVLSHGITDPELPGFYFEIATRLLISDFQEAAQILAPEGTVRRSGVAELRAQLSQVPIDETSIEKSLSMVQEDLGEGPAFSDLLNEVGVALFRQGRFESAETCFRRAFALSEKSMGPTHATTVSSLNHLAELLQATSRLPEAEHLYRQALEVMGPGDPALVATYVNLAGVLRASGRLEEAEQLYRRAIDMLESSPRPPDAVIGVYNNLAMVLRESGRPEEAERLYRRVIEVVERTSPPNDRAVISAYNNLAMMLRRVNRSEEAEELYRRIIGVLEMSAPIDHPTLIGAYHNLAAILRLSGRLDEAEQLYRRTIHALEKSASLDDPALITAYNNLAAMLSRSSRYSEAEQLYRRAIDMLERTSGAVRPASLSSYNNLATMLRRTGRSEEAEQLYRRVVTMLETSVRPGDPALSNAYSNLAAVLRLSDRFDEAEQWYRRAIDNLQRSSRPEGPNLANAYDKLATLLRRSARYHEAEQMYRHAIEVLERTSRPGRIPSLRAYNNLAAMLRDSDRLNEAEQLYRRTVAILEKSPKAKSPELGRALYKLGEVLLDEHRSDEAEETLRRSLDIFGRTLSPDDFDIVRVKQSLKRLLDSRGE